MTIQLFTPSVVSSGINLILFSVTVGVFNGGSLANIVADRAEARVDIRFKTAEEAEKAIKSVEAIAA